MNHDLVLCIDGVSTRPRKIMFERDMAIGKKGYCLVPGHPEQHPLELECWSRLRAWLHDHNGTESQYQRDCKNK